MLLFLLDEILYVPALFVTAAVLAVAFFWRRTSESYRFFWWTAIAICAVLTLCYTAYALSIPLYSQQNHRPDNPGGPGKWSTLPAVVTIMFFVTCLLIPSFPTLFGLAFLPPRNLSNRRRIAFTALIALYVVLVSMLIYGKHVRYMADYRQERAKPRQSPFERFEDRRDSPPSPRQQQQLKRLRERIEQRQKQEEVQQQ